MCFWRKPKLAPENNRSWSCEELGRGARRGCSREPITPSNDNETRVHVSRFDEPMAPHFCRARCACAVVGPRGVRVW